MVLNSDDGKFELTPLNEPTPEPLTGKMGDQEFELTPVGGSDTNDGGFVNGLSQGFPSGLMGVAAGVNTVMEVVGGATGIESLEQAAGSNRRFWNTKRKDFRMPESAQGNLWEDQSLLLNPEWWGYMIGEMAPSLAASVIPAVATAKYINIGGKALKMTPQIASKLARLGGAAAGGLTGGSLEGSSTYQTVLDQGGTPEEARDAFYAMTGASMVLNSASNFVALGGVGTGWIKKGTKFLGAGMTESITEWLEEPAEAVILGEDVVQAMKDGLNVIPPSFLLGMGGGAVASQEHIEGSAGKFLIDKIKNQQGAVGLDITKPAPRAPMFFSKLQDTLKTAFPGKRANAQDIMNMINPKKGAVKEEEVYWSEVIPFLEEHKERGEKVEMAELQDLLLANQIQVNDVWNAQSSTRGFDIEADNVSELILGARGEQLHGMTDDQFEAEYIDFMQMPDDQVYLTAGNVSEEEMRTRLKEDHPDPGAVDELDIVQLKAEFVTQFGTNRDAMFDELMEAHADMLGEMRHGNLLDEAEAMGLRPEGELEPGSENIVNKIEAGRLLGTAGVDPRGMDTAELSTALFNATGKQYQVSDTDIKPTRHKEYAVPGEKSNYRELLLTIDGITDPKTSKDLAFSQPLHFEGHNFVASVRMTERTNDEGERVLFIDELQSDWHRESQDIKEAAELHPLRPAAKAVLDWYYSKVKPHSPDAPDITIQELEAFDPNILTGLPAGLFAKLDKGTSALDLPERGDLYQELIASHDAAREQYNKIEPPFSKWWELATKRLLRLAAEEGYDRIAFANADQIADIWNSRRFIKDIEYRKNTDGTYDIDFIDPIDDNLYLSGSLSNVKKEKLESKIGKDLAERIVINKGATRVDQTTFALQGKEQILGGKGFDDIYDKKVPQFLKKTAKRLKLKMEPTHISDLYRHSHSGETRVTNPKLSGTPEGITDEDKFDVTGKIQKALNWSVKVNDALKKGVLEESQELYVGVDLVKAAEFLTGKVPGWKEFWTTFSSIPQREVLLNARYRQFGDIAKAEDIIKRITGSLENLPIEVRKDVFRFLDGQIADIDLAPEIRKTARSIKERTKTIGKMLVKRGIISQQTYEEHEGEYVHYMYARHILGEDGDAGPNPSTGRMDRSYTIARNPNLTETQKKELGLIEDAFVAVPVGLGKALTDIAKFDYLQAIADNPDWIWVPSTVEVPGEPQTYQDMASADQRAQSLNKALDHEVYEAGRIDDDYVLIDTLTGEMRSQVMGIGALAKETEIYRQLKEQLPDNPDIDAKYQRLSGALERAKQQTGNIPAGYTQMPVSKSYGPLSGAFVRTPIAGDLLPLVSSMVGSGLPGSVRSSWQKIKEVEAKGMTYFKVAKVALNFPTWVRNVGSNFIQNNLRGRPLYKIPGDVINAAQSVKAKDALYVRAKRNGLFQTNFTIAELDSVINEFKKADPSKFETVMSSIMSVAHLYGKIDDVAKHAIFVQMMNDGYSESESVAEAQKWGMDYTLAPRAVKEVRRHIIPFASYQYKIAPLIWESMKKRPWVIGKYLALPTVVMPAIAKEMQDIDEDEWEKLKKDLPHYIRKHESFVVLPFKDPDGRWQWVNLEYYFPWGNWFGLFRDFKDADFAELTTDLGISNPFLDIFTTLRTARSGNPPKDSFTGRPIFNRLDPPHTQAIAMTEWLVNKWAPSMVTRYGAGGYTLRIGEKDKWGRTITPTQAVGRWFGFNVVSVSRAQTAVQKAGRIKSLRGDLIQKLLDPQVDQKEKDRASKKFGEAVREIERGEWWGI